MFSGILLPWPYLSHFTVVFPYEPRTFIKSIFDCILIASGCLRSTLDCLSEASVAKEGS